MKILAERLIAYLKADTTLVTALGSANNISIMGLDQRPQKRVLVSCDVGQDGNSIPTQSGDVEIQIVVSRDIANAPAVCIAIAKQVDDLLNKAEVALASDSWKIINFVRQTSPGLIIDGKDNEYWFPLSYAFILDESV